MYKKESEELRKQAATESELTKTFNAQKAEQEQEEEEDDDDDEAQKVEHNAVSEETGTKQKEQESENENENDQEDPKHEAELILEERRREELEQILYEEKQVPVANVMVLVTLFVVVLGSNLLKGGGAFPSPLGIECGSSGFWIANVLMLGWIFVVSVFVRGYLVRRWEQKSRCGYRYCEGDIQWDGRATIVYPFLCCFAGFFAGYVMFQVVSPDPITSC